MTNTSCTKLCSAVFHFEGIENTDYVNRLKDYVIKAVREAKVYTAWLRPNNYETGFMTL